jgi:hypothetical protein
MILILYYKGIDLNKFKSDKCRRKARFLFARFTPFTRLLMQLPNVAALPNTYVFFCENAPKDGCCDPCRHSGAALLNTMGSQDRLNGVASASN